MRKNIVAGNWKMNLGHQEALSLYNSLKKERSSMDKNTTVIIAPPSIYLSEFSKSKDDKIKLAAQNCNENEKGAFTGEISAAMLQSIGVEYCLVGHSERRAYFNETNELLKSKTVSLLANNITPIYCFGEVLADRESENHFDVVKTQIVEALFNFTSEEIKKIVLAYEPVWAIGTGKTASSAQAQEMHEYVRSLLTEKYGVSISNEISILYGGSCKPTNAKELFSNTDVDGGLIGGAALKSETFVPIINGFSNS